MVNELPETDTENAIYLLPVTEGAEDNLFDEYIWVNGKWEKIGSAAVAVDMTGYVKNTDIASAATPGVVIAGEGTMMASNGKLNIFKAKDEEIIAKSNSYRPIVPANLDLAVKEGVCNNSITLTDEEKAAVRAWLGIE